MIHNSHAFLSPRDMLNSRGFTLVEILAVVGVTAILASILVAGFNGISRNGDKVQEITAGKNLIAAYQAYAADNDGRYLPGMDQSVGQLYMPDGSQISPQHAAERYAFRLAPYFDFKLEGTILVNKNDQQIQQQFKKGSSMYNYAVSLYSVFGINYYFVGGVIDRRGRFVWPGTAECISRQSQGGSSILVFASGGDGKIDGYNILMAPRMMTINWSGADPEGGDPDPRKYGNVDPRYNGRAVCVFLDGSVRMHTIEELRDMRLWNRNALANDDPNYTISY